MKELGKNVKRMLMGLLLVFVPFELISQRTSFERQRKAQIALLENGKYNEMETKNRWYSWETRTTQGYNILMIMEQEMLLLLKQEYERLLPLIKLHEEELFRSRNNRTYLIGYRFQRAPFEYAEKSYHDEFNQSMINHLKHNEQKIINEIKAAKLIEEDEYFLIYFLHLNMYYGDVCMEYFEDKMLASAHALAEKFPSSKYLPFIKKYSRYKKATANWGRDISYIVGGFSTPVNGNYGDHFSTSGNFLGIGYGMNFRNVFAKFEISFSETKVHTPLFEGYKHLWNKTFGGSATRFYLGYSFHFNDVVTLSPFVGYDNRRTSGKIELLTNTSVQKYLEHNQNSLMLGLNIDLNAINDFRCSGDRVRRVYHRFQLGVSSVNVPFGSKHLSSNMFFMQYSFGFNRQRETRFRALPSYVYD
jgi:hypothetical protein